MTPIVFLIFRRPEVTSRVFESIRQARPSKLFIVADGPRNESEVELCQKARDVTEKIDWDCDVIRNYSDVNLGCCKRVSSGLDWVFNQVETAIILEDDCLPSLSFFPYCEELLTRYRHDERVMHIGGHNFLCSNLDSPYSYYFSGLTQVWGWATWRRAWEKYDINMSNWPFIREQYPSIFEIFATSKERSMRKILWDKVFRDEIDTWDYRWLFAVRSQSGLCILPRENLISNIGFGDGATHTLEKEDSLRSNLNRVEITFPLQHPDFMLRDTVSDLTYLQLSSNLHLRSRLKLLIEKIRKIRR